MTLPMLRPLSALLVVAATTGAAFAVDYRWTTGFGQGTLEAMIRNDQGSSLNIYCPSGQMDKTPGFIVEVAKVPAKPKEKVDVQIVIDGENHAFTVEGSQFKAQGRGGLNALFRLVDDLTKSKAESFDVEFPKFKMSERFSLIGAKKAIESASGFLKGCM